MSPYSELLSLPILRHNRQVPLRGSERVSTAMLAQLDVLHAAPRA